MVESGMLDIGSRCFYKGKIYEIMGCYTAKDWMLYSTETPDAFAMVKQVLRTAVEIPVQDKFKLGDRVRSKQSFRGTVTGFEIENNRVVCVSDKIERYEDNEFGCGKRVRYAYKPHELTVYQSIAIIPTQFYELIWKGRNVRVQALKDISTDNVVLYNLADGIPLCKIPMSVEKDDLKFLGIQDLMEVI